LRQRLHITGHEPVAESSRTRRQIAATPDLFGTASRGLSSLIPRKLQLQWNIAVLFPPKGNERGLQPAPERSEPMHARMAGGTKSNEQSRLMNTTPTMMNG
jgi:hypothetical protein